MEKAKIIKDKYLSLLFIGLVLSIGLVSVQASSAASNISVNTTGNDANNGTAAKPYQTISTGISKVDNNGIVHLSKGILNI